MSIQKKVFERVLNMAQMHNIGVLHRGGNMVWTCRWNEAGRESSICYQLVKNVEDKSVKLRLRYKVLADKHQAPSFLDYTVPIKVSLSYKRKVWYWFVCPLIINGKTCGRRVRNLYFLPNSDYFGCKYCRDMMLRSLPVKEQFLFRHTQLATAEEIRSAQGKGIAPELKLGWRPSVTRKMCRECGCLSEGRYCSHCAQPLSEYLEEDFYGIMGLEWSASPEEIHQAFKMRLKEYHPDRVAHLGKKIRNLAEREIKQINLAYETLKHPEKRESYLRELKVNRPRSGTKR